MVQFASLEAVGGGCGLGRLARVTVVMDRPVGSGAPDLQGTREAVSRTGVATSRSCRTRVRKSPQPGRFSASVHRRPPGLQVCGHTFIWRLCTAGPHVMLPALLPPPRPLPEGVNHPPPRGGGADISSISRSQIPPPSDVAPDVTRMTCPFIYMMTLLR